MNLRLDPWSADYGPSMTSVDALDEETAQIEHEAEVPHDQWAPITPPESNVEHVAVVDGVRRADAYLRLEGNNSSVPVMLGTLATGALLLQLDTINELPHCLYRPTVQRLMLIMGDSKHLPTSLPIPGDYFNIEVQGDTPNQLMVELQNRMRKQESVIAAAINDEGCELVLADGPLQNVLKLTGSGVVGYIKSHRRMLLPDSLMPVLSQLDPGQRTPIVRMLSRNSNTYDRFTWYQRLARPLPGETALAGIVRLEVLADLGLEHAQLRASQTGSLLPRMVGGRHRDQRAPQNLAPIAALESELRRRMGAPELIRRQVAQAIQKLGSAS